MGRTALRKLKVEFEIKFKLLPGSKKKKKSLLFYNTKMLEKRQFYVIFLKDDQPVTLS